MDDSISQGKNISLDISQGAKFTRVAKALGSDIRTGILYHLANENLNILEITDKLKIPFSTVALNVKVLEDAGLIITELQPGSRGAVMKICSRTFDSVFFNLLPPPPNNQRMNRFYQDMPIGNYSDCLIYPTCGLATENGFVGADDSPKIFYHPDRNNAQLLWFYKGFVEYRFSNAVLTGATACLLELSMELCSEAPFYRMEWPSDITLWINNVEVCTWTSPGDLGGRRGKYTPDWWSDTATQYGLLKTWQIENSGTFIDGVKVSAVSLKDLKIPDYDFIKVRIGIKDDAKNVGGINVFGEKFGDYAQNITLRTDYTVDK